MEFESPEDKMKVSREDFVVEIEDCSFNNPTCVMAEFEFEKELGKATDKYVAMIIEQKPLIAEKESQIEKIRKQIQENLDEAKSKFEVKYEEREVNVGLFGGDYDEEEDKEEESKQNEDEGESEEELELEAQEYIFLIDRSGSMYWDVDGQPPAIGMAKQALKNFIHSLPEGSKFNIIGFGSSFYPLF